MAAARKDTEHALVTAQEEAQRALSTVREEAAVEAKEGGDHLAVHAEAHAADIAETAADPSRALLGAATWLAEVCVTHACKASDLVAQVE